MVIRTFLEKCNTIVKESENNFGLNPILMLHYGGLISRILVSFDINSIKNRIDGDATNYKHILKLFNCGNIDNKKILETLPSFCGSGERKRASSFDIIAFEIPNRWDSGVGFDSSSDLWLTGDGAISNDGSNWYQAYNGKEWDSEGIFSNEYLSSEYTKFGNNEESLIISRQHFEYGNEMLELDITNYVNDVINGKKKNNGICLAFSPLLEDSFSELTNYVGFFGRNTNTFFQPCVESRTDNAINDNRYDFTLGRENNLFLFIEDSGEYLDLDEMPICTIDGKEYEVSKIRKGCYSARVKLTKNDVEPETILYDIWSNIKIEGQILDDVELDFVVNTPDTFLNIGAKRGDKKEYEPQLSGINDYEKLNRGDKREIIVRFREKFTSSSYKLFNGAEYRLYVKDGDKEYDVIFWDKIEKMSNVNLFYVDTNDLVPNTYYIDIRYKNGSEVKTFKNKLVFEIQNKSNKMKK